jgi:hypothetical protein
MRRSWEEWYEEIARLPLSDRLRLLSRLLADVAGEVGAAGEAATGDQRPTTNDQRQEYGAGSREPGAGSQVDRRPVASSPRRPVAQSASRTRIVLDGSNFLGTVPGYDLTSEAARNRLILRLQEYAHAHPAARVTVYFDGRKASAAVRGGIEIRFSGGPADPFILGYLRAIPVEERHAGLLVTDDAELATAARALGIRIESPRRFHQRIPDPPTTPPDRGLSSREVAEWEEYFRQPKQDKG